MDLPIARCSKRLSHKGSKLLHCKCSKLGSLHGWDSATSKSTCEANSKQRPFGGCLPRDSTKNLVKSSKLKTDHCQSRGDISNVLAPLLLFIIPCLAITGSLPLASEKTESICAPLSLASATKKKKKKKRHEYCFKSQGKHHKQSSETIQNIGKPACGCRAVRVELNGTTC